MSTALATDLVLNSAMLPPQLRLWPELGAAPELFALYGGRLSFFGDVPRLSGEVRERLSAAVEAVDVTKLPVLTAYAPRGENGVKP